MDGKGKKVFQEILLVVRRPVEAKHYVKVGKKEVMHIECYSINGIFLPMDAKIKEVGR